jgi:murein DD-endopeptidase MepM/ murein hydrolase activator NlpD
MVKAGESIAFIGDSGENSEGPHLHFELWENGAPVNPAQYLSFGQESVTSY